MKKLITGGTGLVGSSFKDGFKVGSNVNLCNYDEAYNLIKQEKPDVVIHTAAFVGGLGANIKYPADFYTKNILMNTNIIDVCYKLGVKKLVCFLSTCIFPDSIEYPLKEDKTHLGPPHESNYAYAYAKRMAEVQIKAYNQQYGTQYFCVIPTNIYGPNDNFNLDNAHVIPTLIHKCYLAKKNKTCFEIWGTGSPLREFIYSFDVSNIIDILIKNNNNKNLIISNSKEITIKQIAMLIAKFMNYEGPIIWQKDKPDGQLRKPSDNARLMSVIGDYEFTSIEDGLKKTIGWFLENYPNIRS